ncbi:serine/threonine-protein phosphatase 4 regulatory subunit 4 isoform X3 [Oryzias latipes]|uniref:serine/threonine-protein phosphatase 4 regulatory subunit 4 isoform X3 n=1 Tax=Oryzias latipes TaxID=8090 RepID=UPI000CE26B5F|nr:serine/threonine-protein phosphatase 4 regulatory subunit 4 isoform X3 [Oryzias latipes]
MVAASPLPPRMALSPPSPLCGPPEELQELAFIERPIRRTLKTAEEIDQLTVDEGLNEVERAVYLLSQGQEMQRACVISNLPSLVRQNPAETFRRVVPKVREVLNGAGVEIQLAAAASFLTILQDDIILIHTHTYSILKTVLQQLNHRDTVVSSAWLETLLSAINVLPKETIKQEVLNSLMYQTQMSHFLQGRLAACRILGKVASRFNCHMVMKELLPLARSLLQDVEPEVRACMCNHLESIARAIGEDNYRTELWPELVELAGDEENSVQLASFDTIINLMEMIDGKDLLPVMVPMVMMVCEAAAQADEAVMVSLSFQFGKLCNGLAGYLSEEQKGQLLQRFRLLCVLGLQDESQQTDSSAPTLIRCNCCYNMPAMVAFADSAHFLSKLYSSFSSLCTDPEVSVRRSAAASFHQVLKLISPNSHLVHKEFLLLLQDDSLEVLDALMNHLEETLELLLLGEDSPMLPELLSVLLLAEKKVGSSLRWRLHEKLLQQYSCLARLLSGELLHQSFSHRIFSLLITNKVLPVQKEAARTLCTIMRYNRKQEQRQEMMERLIQDLALGRSYWNRLRFLDVCEIATEIFSKKYFSKYFLIPALELAHDPIANVRYKLCQLLPRLRLCLCLPADKLLLQKLDFCVQKLLCREKDKDVVATIPKTVLELNKLDLSEPFHKRQERDLLDLKKKKEETVQLEMEQLEQDSDGKVTSDRHTERKRRDSKTSLTFTKSVSISSPVAAPPSGKERRKPKLSRSRSLSSQPSSSKPVNSDRPLKVKDLSGSFRLGKSSVLVSKDASLRTSHFTMTTQTTSFMPILVRNDTSLSSVLDRPSILDRTTSVDSMKSVMEHSNSGFYSKDHRTSTLDHRGHRSSTLEQSSKTMERSSGVKDSRSRKLKSGSFSVQSGQD